MYFLTFFVTININIVCFNKNFALKKFISIPQSCSQEKEQQQEQQKTVGHCG